MVKKFRGEGSPPYGSQVVSAHHGRYATLPSVSAKGGLMSPSDRKDETEKDNRYGANESADGIGSGNSAS